MWLMPGSALRKELWPLTGKYISYAGLWQNWGMFAPEPSNLNMYISATVTYQDGSQQEWEFPRMAKLGLFEKYGKERYRKFQEYARLDIYQKIWPDMARWIARENDKRPGNPPVQVALQRNWWFVPRVAGDADISQPPPRQMNRYEFFTLAIQPSDLGGDRR